MTPDRDQSPADPHTGSTKTASLAPAVPRIIGGHRVLRVLGEGGMGIVYEAEQQHPRHRAVFRLCRRRR